MLLNLHIDISIIMDPNFTEQREEFRENLTLGLIPALGNLIQKFKKLLHIINLIINDFILDDVILYFIVQKICLASKT